MYCNEGVLRAHILLIFKPFQSNFWFMLLFYLSDYFSIAIVSHDTQARITMYFDNKMFVMYPIGYFLIIPDIRLLLTVHDANLHKIRKNPSLFRLFVIIEHYQRPCIPFQLSSSIHRLIYPEKKENITKKEQKSDVQ